jgi:hypothetical protein
LFFAQGATFEVAGVATVMKIGASTIKFEYSVCHAIKNVTIVRHEYETAAVTIESIFEPCNRIDVEMVCGFVKDKEVAGSDEGTRKRDALGLTARQATGVSVGERGHAEMVKNGSCFPVALGNGLDRGEDRACRQHRALGERGDSNITTSANGARFGLDLARKYRKQSGLSCSVQSDDPESVSRRKGQ